MHMWKRELEKSRADYRAKLALLKNQWKPIIVLAAVFSYYTYARRLWELSGSLSLTSILVLGLLLLAVLFRFVPVAGLNCVPRAVAFLVDLGFLSLATFSIFSLLRRFDIILRAPALMLVVWLWFLYFVFYETFRHSTLGKRLFGLTLVFDRSGATRFYACFVHNSLSLVAPLIVSDLLVQGVRFPSTAAAFVSIGVVALGPVSILFLGDARGIADRIAGVAVEETGKGDSVRSRAGRSQWLCVCLSCLMITVYLYMATGFIERRLRSVSDVLNVGLAHAQHPTMAELLWVHLPMGLRNPSTYVTDIGVWDWSPNPIRVDPAADLLLLPPYADEVARLNQMRIVRVSLSAAATSIVRTRLLGNFERWYAANTPPEALPAFVLLQLASDEDYGLFTFTSCENLLLCIRPNDAKTVAAFYAQPIPSRSAYVEMWFCRVRWLMLGHLDLIAALESGRWPVMFGLDRHGLRDER